MITWLSHWVQGSPHLAFNQFTHNFVVEVVNGCPLDAFLDIFLLQCDRWQTCDIQWQSVTVSDSQVDILLALPWVSVQWRSAGASHSQSWYKTVQSHFSARDNKETMSTSKGDSTLSIRYTTIQARTHWAMHNLCIAALLQSHPTIVSVSCAPPTLGCRHSDRQTDQNSTPEYIQVPILNCVQQWVTLSQSQLQSWVSIVTLSQSIFYIHLSIAMRNQPIPILKPIISL